MATPSTPTADATTSQTSKEFPPGYGDFTLVSKDGTHFSFPSFLLIHSSGFFRDMFHIAGGPSVAATQTAVLNVKQDEDVLDQFLRRLDPVKTKTQISELETSVVVGLLEAARFYRVPFIFENFEKEVYSPQLGPYGLEEVAFVENYPLVTLSLAFQLGLGKCVQRAIQELMHCHIDRWTNGMDEVQVAIPFPLIQLCQKLRTERVKVYRTVTKTLADHDRSNSGVTIKVTTPVVCIQCAVDRSQWIHKLFTIAVDHPNWTIFHTAYNEPKECTSCKVCWPRDKTKPFSLWKNRVMPETLERNLPELPEWLQEQLERNAETIL